jgi:hypothetical protein
MKTAVFIGSLSFLLGALMITGCQDFGSDIWIVERDIPQTRNLIPVLNRTTLVAAGPGGPATCSVTWNLPETSVRKGRFWPEFGARAQMGLPVVTPEGFPDPNPRVLKAPEIQVEGDRAILSWKEIKLRPGEGAAVHAATWLGPPDLFHTTEGLAFGDIRLETRYEAKVGDGATGEGTSVTLVCRLSLKNTHLLPVEDLEFSFFFPRALLDNKTGEEIPILNSFTYQAAGFSDTAPLDLLISDGLGRGAWGPRFVWKARRLDPGESRVFSVEVTGTIAGGEILVVPLVSIVARIQARYWPSSEVEVTPPGRVHYSDYTHFNLVVADSRLFRIKRGEANVEASSPEVRKQLGTGLEKD